MKFRLDAYVSTLSDAAIRDGITELMRFQVMMSVPQLGVIAAICRAYRKRAADSDMDSHVLLRTVATLLTNEACARWVRDYDRVVKKRTKQKPRVTPRPHKKRK